MLKKISDKARNKMYLRTIVREYIDSGICPWCGEDLVISAVAAQASSIHKKCPSGCNVNNIEEVE